MEWCKEDGVGMGDEERDDCTDITFDVEGIAADNGESDLRFPLFFLVPYLRMTAPRLLKGPSSAGADAVASGDGDKMGSCRRLRLVVERGAVPIVCEARACKDERASCRGKRIWERWGVTGRDCWWNRYLFSTGSIVIERGGRGLVGGLSSESNKPRVRIRMCGLARQSLNRVAVERMERKERRKAYMARSGGLRQLKDRRCEPDVKSEHPLFVQWKLNAEQVFDTEYLDC